MLMTCITPLLSPFDRHDLTNPTYDAKMCASSEVVKTLPDYEDHIYDTITYTGEEEKQESAASNRAPLNHYENFSHAATIDSDRMSITSNDIDEAGDYCASDVKESKVRYSKKNKPRPPPKQKESSSTAKVAPTKVSAKAYDVPSTPAVSVGTEYAALHTARTNTAVDNDYQELVVHPVPPGYDVPRNIPATATLESYRS